MRPTLHTRRGLRLLALIAGLGCTSSVLAQAVPFSGRWLLDNPPKNQAVYTTLTIKDTSMSWHGQDQSVPPPCVQQFVLQQEPAGTVYANGRGTKFIAGVAGSLPTYLLKIGSGTCAGIEDAVRISYPLVYDVAHIEVIEYVKGKPVTSRRFHRAK